MSYGYDSVAALMSSIFPSTKYVSIGQSVALSSVWGVICSVLGIWPILALAMIFVMVIESCRASPQATSAWSTSRAPSSRASF